jgi:small GTP-binding protein
MAIKYGPAEEIKVILVGESGTGKTSLINTSIGIPFKENMITSASNSFAPKEFQVDGKKYILNLWDTIGQEKFRSLTKIFIKDSKIVVFVYDITNEKSFKELEYWITTIKDILKDEAVLGIAGNKQDLFKNEKVKEETAKKYAQEKNVIFELTSAKNKKTFEKLLENLLKQYIEKNGGSDQSDSNAIKLGEKNSKGNNNKKFC